MGLEGHVNVVCWQFHSDIISCSEEKHLDVWLADILQISICLMIMVVRFVYFNQQQHLAHLIELLACYHINESGKHHIYLLIVIF